MLSVRYWAGTEEKRVKCAPCSNVALQGRKRTHEMQHRALPTECNFQALMQGTACDVGHMECRRVIQALADQESWEQHVWAYDGQKMLYTARMFLQQHETEYQVCCRAYLCFITRCSVLQILLEE